MVYRERWTQSIFECLAQAQQISQGDGQSETKVEVSMLDLEWIAFERWLENDTCSGSLTASEIDHEKACKARVAFAYKRSTLELNSWLDFGDDDNPVTINIVR